MAPKRPLETLPPEKEGPQSPGKRLRRTVLLVMERRRASAVTLEQMVRQARLDMARLFMLLTVLVAQLGSMETLLNNMIQRSLAEQIAALQSSFMVSIQDTIRSTLQTAMQGRQAASIPNVINGPPRQMSEGFPESGGNTGVKLRFVDVDRPQDPIYTGYPVQWLNKKDAKVAVFENDRQITQGDLSKLQIEILAVHAEFFTERGQADFTKEEFNKQICIHKGNESVLTTVNLANGAAYIGSIMPSSQEDIQRGNSSRRKTKKREWVAVFCLSDGRADPVPDRRDQEKPREGRLRLRLVGRQLPRRQRQQAAPHRLPGAAGRSARRRCQPP